MNISQKIKKLRKEERWSQAELAGKLEIHMNHLSKLETGKFTPSIELLKKISDVFKVSTDYLLNDSAEEFEPLNLKGKPLYEKLRMVEELDEKDQNVILDVIETYLMKHQMWDVLKKKASERVS